LYIIIVVIICL